MWRSLGCEAVFGGFRVLEFCFSSGSLVGVTRVKYVELLILGLIFCLYAIAVVFTNVRKLQVLVVRVLRVFLQAPAMTTSQPIQKCLTG